MLSLHDKSEMNAVKNIHLIMTFIDLSAYRAPSPHVLAVIPNRSLAS